MSDVANPVFISEDALEAVRRHADAAAPFETGGLLIGVTTAESVWIAAFAEVDVSKRHRSRFVIPVGATHATVDDHRGRDPRVGYLGDWHTHPANAGASRVDFETLAGLALGSLRRPRLMVLLRRVGVRWDLDLWSMSRLRRPRRVLFERTGPLPSADVQASAPD